MDNIWNQLLEFETRDLVKSYFEKVHNSKVNDWKVREVTANFIQGREYFKSAEVANITIKPLLLYYGVLSLSRGLILTLKPKLTEKTLKKSHGIRVKNWDKVLKSKEFENLEISVDNGSFLELIKATENINYRMKSSKINANICLPIPESGYRVNLKNFYWYLPDLESEFRNWINSSLPFAIIEEYIHSEESNMTSIKLIKHNVDCTLIDLIFPEKYYGKKEVVENEYFEISYVNDKQLNITQKWDTYGAFGIGIGEVCVVPMLADNKGFNTISTMYALSYTYGMMARYYPSSWISLGRVEEGDRIYPLIHRTLDFIESKFPVVVLDFLRVPYEFKK